MDLKFFSLMKRVTYIVGLILCFFIGYIFAVYTYPKPFKFNPSTTVIPPITNPAKDNKPNLEHVVDIPLKYFDPESIFKYGNTTVLFSEMLDVSLAPVTIPKPAEIKVINEEYNPKEKVLTEPDFGPKIYGKDIDNDGDFENNIKDGASIDVDNDGKKERTVYGSIAMNHGSAKVVIVKNGRIIFRSDEKAGFQLIESKSHNGFYITETIESGSLFGVGGARITRYIFENGGFFPVWYKDTFELQTTDTTPQP
jgi:hypothetical protein